MRVADARCVLDPPDGDEGRFRARGGRDGGEQHHPGDAGEQRARETTVRRHDGTSSGHTGGVYQKARSHDVDRQDDVVHLEEIV
jgi:hypothetical protein